MLALAPDTTLSPDMTDARTALDIPDDLTMDGWKDLGRRLCTFEKNVQWWIGDWWVYGDQRYGARAKAVADNVFGRTYQSFRDLGSVARRFEPSRRRDDLSFSHHAEVLALAPSQATEVLERAAENKWSIRDTRAEVLRRKLNIVTITPEPCEPIPIKALPPQANRRLVYVVKACFRDWFGIGEAGAALLMTLYNAKGQAVSPGHLSVSIDSHRPMSTGALHEAVSSLRKAFDAEAIDRNENGYLLSEIGLHECRTAMLEIGALLLAAGCNPDDVEDVNRMA